MIKKKLMKKVIGIFLILIASQSVFAQSGWQNTFYQYVSAINKLVKVGDSTYCAFCYDGKNYFKTTNGGLQWNTFQFSDSANYRILDGKFLNSNTGWIVGNNYNNTKGVVLKTTNGGINWQPLNSDSINSYCKSLSLLNENTGWVVSRGSASFGNLYKTTNGGNTWNTTQFLNSQNMQRVKFFDNENGWVCGFDKVISKTTNGGLNWTNKIVNNVANYTYVFYSDIYPVSMNECWALLSANNLSNVTNLVYKTTDGGDNWTLMYSYTDGLNGNSSSIWNIEFTDSQTGYLSGGFNFIAKTTNGGINWNSLSTSIQIYSILPLNNVQILAGGINTQNTAIVLKSTDEGGSWNQIFSNRNYNFVGVYFKDFQNGLAIEEKGVIFRTSNGGTSWNKIYENSSYVFSLIKFPSDTNGLIFCNAGKFLRTSDFGNNWTELTTPLAESKSKVIFINELTGFALGTGQNLYTTSNGGLNWNIINVPLTGGDFTPLSGYSDMSFINSNTGWMCAAAYTYIPHGQGFYSYSNVIKKTVNGGLSWYIVYSSSSSFQYKTLKFFTENRGWTWISNLILETTDSGFSWNVLNTNPTFIYKKLEMFNESTGWIGGSDYIVKTTNAGVNWFLQLQENGINVNSIFIKDENNVWFTGSNNRIYKTTNGGGIISAINQINSETPNNFSLSQNYPNPFNPSTKINYEVKSSGFVSLKVFDLLGKEVASLVNEKQNAGSYAVVFNSSEFNLPSGIYFYTLNAGEFKETRKMVLVK